MNCRGVRYEDRERGGLTRGRGGTDNGGDNGEGGSERTAIRNGDVGSGAGERGREKNSDPVVG